MADLVAEHKSVSVYNDYRWSAFDRKAIILLDFYVEKKKEKRSRKNHRTKNITADPSRRLLISVYFKLNRCHFILGIFHRSPRLQLGSSLASH